MTGDIYFYQCYTDIIDDTCKAVEVVISCRTWVKRWHFVVYNIISYRVDKKCFIIKLTRHIDDRNRENIGAKLILSITYFYIVGTWLSVLRIGVRFWNDRNSEVLT